MKFQSTLIIATLILLMTSCSTDQKITDLSGKVKYETIAVSTKVAGRVSDIYVTEGQKVQKGDTLALIDIPEVDAKMLQVEGAIYAAESQLLMAKNGATGDQVAQISGQLEAAKVQQTFAEESFARVSNMYADSLISAQQYDEVKMKLEMAKAQVSALKGKYDEVVNGTRSEVIGQAKGQLSRAEGVKSEVLVANKEKYIIAPADMTIETIALNVGELATPGYTIFNGYELNSLYFRFTVSESKVYNYQLNQEITIVNPNNDVVLKCKLIAIKQLARYADISSTAPAYELSEAIYELKLEAVEPIEQDWYVNSTVLIK